MARTVREFLEGIQMLHAGNLDQHFEVSAAHDIIYLSGNITHFQDVAAAKRRLESNGFHWDERYDCWAYGT